MLNGLRWPPSSQPVDFCDFHTRTHHHEHLLESGLGVVITVSRDYHVLGFGADDVKNSREQKIMSEYDLFASVAIRTLSQL